MKALFYNAASRKAFAALLLLAASASLGHAQTTQYSATTGTANPETTTSYAQQFTLAGGANHSYSISGITLSLYQPSSTTTSFVYLDFYTGADTSPTATDALANATYITTRDFQIPAQSTTSGYVYTLNFTPFTLNTGTFFMDVALTDTTGQNYQSTSVIEGNFTLAAPSAGTSPGFVWNDTNHDGTFAGSEQTTFGAAAASIRMTVNASIVPEPGTNAALACGALALFGGWSLRRRRVAVRG